MDVVAPSLLDLDNSYVRELEGLYRHWQGAPAPQPRLLVLNDALAAELGLDADALRSDDGVAVLVGNAVPEGATPVAQAYAGHQFGNYSPRLGDGRALLVGELHDTAGRRRDLHLKGSGRTPFARGGDGRAVVGPMLREYLVSEAMHALGIPTTRSLAVVATGEDVARETGWQPGAVLARVASSHLRVGTFQYAAALAARSAQSGAGSGAGSGSGSGSGEGDAELVRRLADHAIARHHPQAADAERPYLALLEAVVEVQASLIAQWMLVGFVHGVMNTDNMTISGETIDYGPCAFLDAFDPATVYSSIDHAGRYAYGNQPRVAQWNLARLAEALLPLIDDDTDAAVAAATEVLQTFGRRYTEAFTAGMASKLGLEQVLPGDESLIDDLLALMAANKVDHTAFFRGLSSAVRADPAPARDLVTDRPAYETWAARWQERLDGQGLPADVVADAMDRVNPAYIPRNHLVEEALTAAMGGDTEPFEQMLVVLSQPYDVRPGLERYAEPAPESLGGYTTYCGT